MIDPVELKALVEMAARPWNEPGEDTRAILEARNTLAEHGLDLARQVLALSEEVERLEEEASVWPDWAQQILKIMKRYGYEYPAGDDVDLPQDVEDWLENYDNEEATRNAVERATAAEADAKALRQKLGEIREIAKESAGAMVVGGSYEATLVARLDRIAALAAIQDGKEPQRRVVDGPACPTRGFRIVREENPTFIIEDDQP